MPTCAECNNLPTTHQCVYCRVAHVCPECCDKRGITVLSEITCESCQEKNIAGTGSENDDNMIPPPEQNSTMEEQEIDCSTGRSNEGSKSNDRSGESDAVSLQDVTPVQTKNFREILKPPSRMNKKLGKNAEASTMLKNISPINPIREMYPNTYKKVSLSGQFFPCM